MRTVSGPFPHAVPDDVDTAILSHGELRSTNCAHGHGSMRLSVDPDGFGKLILSRVAMNVKDVAGSGLAFEVDEVNDSFGVRGSLRLDAVVRCADRRDCDGLGSGKAGDEREGQDDVFSHT